MLVTACRQSGGEANQAANDAAAANEAVANEAAAPIVDTKSPAAARSVMTDYAALAEKGDFAKAADYWTNASNAAQFAADLENYPKVAMSVGEPGEMEGAAGSSFITVPTVLNLTLRSGAPYSMTCKAVLRRVNDVAGATEKQLRWNIQSIDC
jgi:hypothetical protein